MKILLSLSILILSSNAFSIEYILEWKESKKNEVSFKDRMEENQCHYLKEQEELFKGKNRKQYEAFKINNKIKIQNCKQHQKFTDEELGITSWNKTTVSKGFILSKEMEKLGCKEIFNKQIPHFKEKNKTGNRNLNVLHPEEEIILQSCIARVVESKTKFDKIFRVGVGFENYSNYKKENYNSLLRLQYDHSEMNTFFGEFSQERQEIGHLFKTPWLIGTRVSVANFQNDLRDEIIIKPDLMVYFQTKYLDLFANYSTLKEFQKEVGFGGIIKINEYHFEFRRDNYLNKNIFTVGFKF